MNTKTTKFLAVLAVFAMAFAVFAVVAPSDAGTTEVTADLEIKENKTTWTEEELGFDAIYVSASVSITVDGAFTNAVTFYVKTGVTPTFTFTKNQTVDVKVMSGNLKAGVDTITVTVVDNTGVTFGKISSGTTFKSTGSATGSAAIAISALSGGVASVTTESAGATIKVSGDMTVNGVVTLGGTTTIDIASGKVLSITNTKAANNYCYGINATGKTLSIVGDGKLKISVTAETASIATDHSLNAVAIRSGTLTIKTNVEIDAVGTCSATGNNYVYGCGIMTGALTIGDTSTAGKVVTVTGNDRAIYSTGETTFGKITINATGGEYGVKANAGFTATDTTLTAIIKDANSNHASDDAQGDGYVGIKVKAATTINGASTITSDGILAQAANITINGTSVVKVTANSDALLTNGGSWTKVTEGNAYSTGVWTKNIYGLVCATYNGNPIDATPWDGTDDVFSSLNSVTLANSAKLQVEPGCGIIAEIKNGTSDYHSIKFDPVLAISGTDESNVKKVMAMPMVVGGSSNLVFGVGSVVMDGYVITGSDSAYTVADGKITVHGTIELSGEIDVDISMDNSAKIVVPAGKTLDFGKGGDNGNTITVGTSTEIAILGEITGKLTIVNPTNVTVRATNVEAVKDVIKNSSDITIKDDSKVKVLAAAGLTAETLRTAISTHTYVAISNSTAAAATLTLSLDLEILSGKTLFLGVGNAAAEAAEMSELTAGAAVYITIGENNTFTVDNAKIYDYSSTKSSKITVSNNASFILNAADVCTIVDVVDKGYVNITNPLNLDATGTPTSDLNVGYGNTLTINKLNIPNGKAIYVYGNLVAEGTNTVAYGGKILTYEGSTMTVNGSLSVEGTVTTNGYTDIEGSVSVYRAGGYAKWIDYGLTVVYGTFDVTKERQSGAGSNSLTVNGSDDKEPGLTGFYLFGTSTISGTFAGEILDYGELTFNGTAGAGSEIEIRDDVTLTVNSVTGTLKVTDSDAAIDDTWDAEKTTPGYKDYATIFDGNEITLINVKGLTITEDVTVTTGKVKVGTEEKTVKYYISVLDVTGTTSAVDDDASVAVKGGSFVNYAYKTYQFVLPGCVSVGDLTVGKKCELEFDDNGTATNVTVSGTITAVAQDAEITFSNAKGKVDVLGQIFVNDAYAKKLVGFDGKVNAAYYTYDGADGSINYVLEPFETALDSILTADDKMISIHGDQYVYGTAIIPATGSVHVTNGSALYVTADADLTVLADGVLDASAGKLAVAGILFITDKDTGLRYNTTSGMFVYQVMTENETSVMYSGIAGALLRAQAGDIITMVQDGTLGKDATIPAGVTLIIPNGKTLKLGTANKEMTFTIDGMLILERNAAVAEAADATATILDNGAIVKDSTAAFDISITGTETSKIKMDNYVEFAKKIDGRDTTIYSNIEFAAATMDGGELKVYGKVRGGDVVFAGTESEIVIKIENESSTTHQNGLAVSSMTLVNSKVIIGSDAGSTAGVFSGTIIAGSETGDASIILSNATGVTISAETEETAEGEVDHFYIGLTEGIKEFDGTVNINLGTVTMNGDLKTNGQKSSVFKVGENALFVIASEKTFTVAKVSGATNVVVDGMMLVNGTLDVNGSMSVAGILTVIDAKSGKEAVVNLNATMTVKGSVIVSDDAVLGGTFNINSTSDSVYGKLVLGTAATALGDGATLMGPVDIKGSYAYIVAYPGADISDAKIDWNALTESSDAVSTKIYVFETLYATVFADKNTGATVYNAVFSSTTKIEGYDVKNSWDAVVTDAQGKATTTLVYWFTDSAYKTNMTNTAKIGAKSAAYFTPALAKVYGKVTVGVGITLYLDGKVYEKVSTEDVDFLTVGKHTVSVQIHSGYVGDNVTLKFNGVTVPATATGGTITVTADMVSFTLVADGAEPYTPEPTPEPEKESEWTITTILLCVLVVLIAIMAVIVALRLNRN